MVNYIWLVVYLPLWKIWLRQLGWFFPIYGKIKNVPNHQPAISSTLSISVVVCCTLENQQNSSFEHWIALTQTFGYTTSEVFPEHTNIAFRTCTYRVAPNTPGTFGGVYKLVKHRDQISHLPPKSGYHLYTDIGLEQPWPIYIYMYISILNASTGPRYPLVFREDT